MYEHYYNKICRKIRFLKQKKLGSEFTRACFLDEDIFATEHITSV